MSFKYLLNISFLSFFFLSMANAQVPYSNIESCESNGFKLEFQSFKDSKIMLLKKMNIDYPDSIVEEQITYKVITDSYKVKGLSKDYPYRAGRIFAVEVRESLNSDNRDEVVIDFNSLVRPTKLVLKGYSEDGWWLHFSCKLKEGFSD